MNGIEKITAKIREDAEAEIARLTAETDAKIAGIQAQAAAQAEKERADILARGRKAADERLERLESAAQMEQRKLALGAKQEVVGEAFEKAVDYLCSLSDDKLIPLLTALAVEASSTGKEALVFSVKDRARIGKQVVIAANEELTRRARAGSGTGTAQLTLSEKTRPMKGGFVMADEEVEVNCTFETLVRLQREKLEREVANVLFQ